MSGQLFHAVDITVTVPGETTAPEFARGWGSTPWGALIQRPVPAEATETLRFSDVGYVSDSHGAWPPLVQQAYSLDRRLDLRPDAQAGSESWGSLVLSSPNGLLDHVIATRVVDRMPMRVRYGWRGRDAIRGCVLDPPEAALQPAFAGLGRSWQPDRQSVEIALTDATAWLDAPAQGLPYDGKGGRNGGADLAGRYRPKLCGRAFNLAPVAIDTIKLVYQVSDAPGTIEALYEGGAAGGIVFAGQVADVFATDPPPGHYVVQSDSSGLWFRLGTRPVWAITLDATGALPDGTTPGGLLTLLRGVLLQDCQLAPGLFDPAWLNAEQVMTWSGGWYWDGSARVTGREVADTLLSGLGVRLAASRQVQVAHAALDRAGRFLFGLDHALAQVVWSTPQAAELIAHLPPEIMTEVATPDLPSLPPGSLLGYWLIGEIPHRIIFVGRENPGTLILSIAPIPAAPEAILRQKLGLSMREAEVLLWISRGKSSRDIAEILQISPRTIDKHTEQLYNKAGFSGRAAAAATALRLLGETE